MLASADIAVGEEARAEIARRLAEIESIDTVKIVLAVESGSRAWGFHSPDSDYDARFIFVRREDDYLSLFQPRDVIETPIEGLFDVNGWDLGKALRLMMRGNSVVHEWLASPIVYRAAPSFMSELTPVARAWRSAFADVHHYYGLLQSQWGRFIADRDRVKLKKYFYVVRPALALQWLPDRGGAPPMDLPRLLAGITAPADAVFALEQLRQAKQHTTEMGEGPRIPELDAYIMDQAAWGLSAKPRSPAADTRLIEQTNLLFRRTIRGEVG